MWIVGRWYVDVPSSDLWFDILVLVDDSTGMVRAFPERLHWRNKQTFPPPTLLAGMHSKYQLWHKLSKLWFLVLVLLGYERKLVDSRVVCAHDNHIYREYLNRAWFIFCCLNLTLI
jgi:hypothetical protein